MEVLIYACRPLFGVSSGIANFNLQISINFSFGTNDDSIKYNIIVSFFVSEQENIARNRLQYNNENNICRGIRRARAKESLSAGYIGKRQTGIAKCKVRALLSKFNHADNMEGMWQQLTDKARGTLKVLDFIC